jgi:hypothetical protein
MDCLISEKHDEVEALLEEAHHDEEREDTSTVYSIPNPLIVVETTKHGDGYCIFRLVAQDASLVNSNGSHCGATLLGRHRRLQTDETLFQSGDLLSPQSSEVVDAASFPAADMVSRAEPIVASCRSVPCKRPRIATRRESRTII